MIPGVYDTFLLFRSFCGRDIQTDTFPCALFRSPQICFKDSYLNVVRKATVFSFLFFFFLPKIGVLYVRRHRFRTGRADGIRFSAWTSWPDTLWDSHILLLNKEYQSLFPAVRRPELEYVHSFPSSASVSNALNCSTCLNTNKCTIMFRCSVIYKVSNMFSTAYMTFFREV